MRLRVVARQETSAAEQVIRAFAEGSEFLASRDGVGRWRTLDEAVYGDLPAGQTLEQLGLGDDDTVELLLSFAPRVVRADMPVVSVPTLG